MTTYPTELTLFEEDTGIAWGFVHRFDDAPLREGKPWRSNLSLAAKDSEGTFATLAVVAVYGSTLADSLRELRSAIFYTPSGEASVGGDYELRTRARRFFREHPWSCPTWTNLFESQRIAFGFGEETLGTLDGT